MKLRPAIASMSLGRAWVHDIDEKFGQASKAGFGGVEIFYEDLEYLAKDLGDTSEANLLRAAAKMRQSCDNNNLNIIGLQPFLFYEGLLDRKEHMAKLEKLKTWFKIVKILGTDIIQIPSNFQSGGTSGDTSLIVADMIELADLGLQEDPPVRFVYENIAWGNHIDTWEQIWEVVTLVDRINFGCCLDTFQIAGRIWADPAVPTGKATNGDLALEQSLQRLVQQVDVSKVFYIQIADAEKLEQPLVEGHPFYVEGQPARMSWSRNCRLFLYEHEKGGYLPAVKIVKVFIEDLKYEGWVSMELFSRSMSDPDPTVPETHAQRGINSWKLLIEDLRL